MKHTRLLLHAFLLPLIALVALLAAALPAGAATPLEELQGKYVTITAPCAAEVEKDHWYVMYNVGRKGFLCDDESKLHLCTAPPSPDAMKYLVRITDVGGVQCLQTGIGRYFKYLSTSNNNGTTTTCTASNNAFTYGPISDGCFWLKDKNGMVLDANALGTALDANTLVAGWGKDTPTSATGNNSWRFFPVEFFDATDELADVPYTVGNFSFQSVSEGTYLHLDANNLSLTADELQGTALWCIDGTWSLGVAEGSGQKTHVHIGTGGKFSAGPSSPITLYRVSEVDGGSFVYTKAQHIIDGGTYLIVGQHEGSDYAMLDIVDKSGTADQRMLSSKVTFADDGTATFTGTNASDAAHHHWQLHYGAGVIQEPFVYTVGETGGASGSGKPLLTIACVSDIHTQDGWISNTGWADQENGIPKSKMLKDVRVRESLAEAVTALKKENVDVLIVGGDCHSDVTVTEEHWRKARTLMAEALRSVKSAADTDDTEIPVLYVNGNHEYEVASTWGGSGKGYYNWRHTRPFNAGEYYDFPMLSDIGVLAADYDCFYDEAPNDAATTTKKTMPVLAAYHYSIKGFDFVVLNCGKHLFHNANNYSYSDESVAWVERKLQQIYADDPSHSKTVFFALHIPFGDSNSINTSEDKGMSYYDSTHRLKKVLAQYPGLVMLYGHDHGQDLAYIRTKTSQRVTRYDTQGNVMATADGVISFDKDITTGEPMKVKDYTAQSVIFHPYSGKTTASLGVRGTYLVGSAAPQRTLALLDTPSTCTLIPETDGGISLRLGDGSQHLVFNNGFGLSSADHQRLVLYRVSIEGDNFTVAPVQQAEPDGIYLIGSDTHVYKVGATRPLSPADSYAVSAFNSYFWRAEIPADAQPSFVSSFMGSMRYYANSNGEPAAGGTGARKLIQGLIIYVYPDRIVFNMKNFRNNVGARVRNELAPYVIRRATTQLADEEVVKHNPSQAYYRRVDDLAQLTDRSVCLLVDETRHRALGTPDVGTGKFSAIELQNDAEGHIAVSPSASACELIFEKKPEGAIRLENGSDQWYLRTHDGYIKNNDTRLYYRQQSLNYASANPLANESMTGSIVPWTVTMTDEGVVNIENDLVGPLKKQSTGMTTGTFHLYQKVVAPVFDAQTHLAAYYSEHALMMPEGTEAYTISSLADDGSLRFVRQTTKVPAKTGLILRQQGQTASVEIPVIEDRYAAALSNYLGGTLADRTTTPPLTEAGTTAADYRFYRFDGNSFKAVDAEAAPFVNTAGQAFLALPSALAEAYESAPATALTARLDGAESNGIKDIVYPAALTADDEVFNLAGQRVGAASTLPAGLYIVGGKKMMVK